MSRLDLKRLYSSTRSHRAAMCLALLLLLLMPGVVQANAGTPLMWAGIMHLWIGNFLLGIAEGVALGWLFARPIKRCIVCMIPANYFSAWIGATWILPSITASVAIDLSNGWAMYWLTVAVLYLITLVLEFPFIALALKGTGWFRNSLKGTLIIQSASYLLLFGWYWGASGTSLFTDTRLVNYTDMSLPPGTVLYYISDTDNDVWRKTLDDGKERPVFDLNSDDLNDRLVIGMDDKRTTTRLSVRLETSERFNPEYITIFGKIPANWWVVREKPSGDRGYLNTLDHYGRVPLPVEFREHDQDNNLSDPPHPTVARAEANSWEYYNGFWPIEGLVGTHTQTQRTVHISFETPLVQWYIRNATQLPNDTVIFQLGEDQICAFDPNKMQLALIARGRGPVVVIEDDTDVSEASDRITSAHD